MGLAKSTGISDDEKRDVVDQKDLLGQTFFIERIGGVFTDKKFGYKKIPVDITLEGGLERVWFARGTAIVRQLTDEGTEAGFTAMLAKVQGEDATKNPYYVLEEVEVEA